MKSLSEKIVHPGLQITYPKSFLKLLLFGFALAMLPLLTALVNANVYFDRLTRQSLFNMSQAVETTRAGRILLEELAVMERSARQYFVLHDKVLLTNYLNAHAQLTQAVDTLSPVSYTHLDVYKRQDRAYTHHSYYLAYAVCARCACPVPGCPNCLNCKPG